MLNPLLIKKKNILDNLQSTELSAAEEHKNHSNSIENVVFPLPSLVITTLDALVAEFNVWKNYVASIQNKC